MTDKKNYDVFVERASTESLIANEYKGYNHTHVIHTVLRDAIFFQDIHDITVAIVEFPKGESFNF